MLGCYAGADDLARVVRRDTYVEPPRQKPRKARCSFCGRRGFLMAVVLRTGAAVSCACGHAFGTTRHP